MNAVDELNLKLGIGPKRPALPSVLQRAGYTSIKTIGKGSFGQAHLLFHSTKKLYVVAKHVNLATLTPKQISEARNEITLLQSFEHPNIVKYFECVEEHPNLYILMEYCDGGDVFETLTRQATLGIRYSESEALALFVQIAMAVRHLHDKRVLHRDLKSQNVFLMKNGVAKLGDFGISTSLKSTMAMAKTMCGTPYYFSPELVHGKPYNNKSDIWALGVLLYELLTQKMPFSAKSMKLLLDAIINQPAPRLPPHCSREVQDLFDSMLSKEMSARPDINGVLRSPVLQKFVPELALNFLSNKQPHLVAPKVSGKEQVLPTPPEKTGYPRPMLQLPPAPEMKDRPPPPPPPRHEPQAQQSVAVPAPIPLKVNYPPISTTNSLPPPPMASRTPVAHVEVPSAVMQKSCFQVAEVLQESLVAINCPKSATEWGDDPASAYSTYASEVSMYEERQEDAPPEVVSSHAESAGRYDDVEEDESFSGSCYCGEIIFTLYRVRKTYCSHSAQLRRLTCGAFVPFVVVDAVDFVIEHGKEFLKPFHVAEGSFTRAFCLKCGTTVVNLYPASQEAQVPLSNICDPGHDLFPVSHEALEEAVGYFPTGSLSDNCSMNEY